MTNPLLRPQGQAQKHMSGKGPPSKVTENSSSGGGTYPQSAGPLTADANARKSPKQLDQAKGMPKAPSAQIPPRVPTTRATYDGPESVKPKTAPSTGDRGIA